MIEYKYARNNDPRNRKSDRKYDPNKWITGPDPLRREKRYAWLKHRAQAKYRDEEYQLSFEEWESVWTDELFLRRGRSNTSMCLMKVDHKGPWSIDNVSIVTRGEQLKRAGEYKKDDDDDE